MALSSTGTLAGPFDDIPTGDNGGGTTPNPCPPDDAVCNNLQKVSNTEELQCDGSDNVCPILRDQMSAIQSMASGGGTTAPIRLPLPCASNGCSGALRKCDEVIDQFEKMITDQASEEICAAYQSHPDGVCNIIEQPHHARNTQCDGTYIDFDADGNITWKKNARILAFYRALSIQSFKKGIEVVVDEMKSGRQIVVPASSGIYPIAQAALALMYRNYKSNTEKVAKSAINKICTATQGPVGSICSQQAATSDQEVIQFKQYDCRLTATRSSIENVFINLALTKAYDEASSRYYAAFSQVQPKVEDYANRLKNYVESQDCWSEGCGMRAARRFWKNGELRQVVFEPIFNSTPIKTSGTFLLPTAEQGNSCGSKAVNGLNTQGASMGLPPSSPTPRTADMPWEFLLGGIMGFRRRRETKKNTKNTPMLVLFVALATIAGSVGCGSDVPEFDIGDIPENQDGDGMNFGNGGATFGKGAVSGIDGGFSQQDQTDEMKANGLDGLDDIKMAAGAADGDSGGQVADVAHGGGGGGGGTGNIPKLGGGPKASGGGGGGFGGGGGGGGSKLGEVSTGTGGGGIGDGKELAAKVEESGGAYAGNGGKKAAAAGGPKGFNPFGRRGGPGGEGSAGSGDLSFGEDAGGKVDPMGSQDPEDYFARIGVWESIFKIVERRYRHETGGWALRETETLVNGRAPASAPNPK